MKLISINQDYFFSNDLSPILEVSALTIGVFDALHIGHLELLKKLKEISKKGKTALITFSDLPESVVSDKAPVKILQPQIRDRILSNLNIDFVVELEAGKKLFEMPAEVFLDRFFSMVITSAIAVGSDFRFGKDKRGDSQLLKNWFGDKLTVVPQVMWEGKVASSTIVRKMLIEGELEKVTELLGRNYSFIGSVTAGDGIGSKLGFPTLNLVPTPSALSDGVYVVKTGIGDGVAHIGARPTLDKQERRFEVHIISENDAKINLTYDTKIEVDFLNRIRSVEHFKSQDDLKARIKKDIEEAKKIICARQDSNLGPTA